MCFCAAVDADLQLSFCAAPELVEVELELCFCAAVDTDLQISFCVAPELVEVEVELCFVTKESSVGELCFFFLANEIKHKG